MMSQYPKGDVSLGNCSALGEASCEVHFWHQSRLGGLRRLLKYPGNLCKVLFVLVFAYFLEFITDFARNKNKAQMAFCHMGLSENRVYSQL